MSTSHNARQSNGSSKKELPSTYIMHEREHSRELERLEIQDRLVTASMGGPLAEQSDTERMQRILDIGCGSGGWSHERRASITRYSIKWSQRVCSPRPGAGTHLLDRT